MAFTLALSRVGPVVDRNIQFGAETLFFDSLADMMMLRTVNNEE